MLCNNNKNNNNNTNNTNLVSVKPDIVVAAAVLKVEVDLVNVSRKSAQFLTQQASLSFFVFRKQSYKEI